MPELICTHSLSQLHKISGAQVRRGVEAAAAATRKFLVLDWTFSWFWIGLSLGYGLEFLLGMISLESGTLPWLAIGSRVFFQHYSLCQG